MYYPQEPPKEPGGCIQSLLISRAILGILMVPILLILGAMFAIVLTFYTFTVHPLFGVAVIGAIILGLVALGKWEAARIAKEAPRDDE